MSANRIDHTRLLHSQNAIPANSLLIPAFLLVRVMDECRVKPQHFGGRRGQAQRNPAQISSIEYCALGFSFPQRQCHKSVPPRSTSFGHLEKYSNPMRTCHPSKLLKMSHAVLQITMIFLSFNLNLGNSGISLECSVESENLAKKVVLP